MTNCKRCGHEKWAHGGSDYSHCDSYQWIKVNGPFPIEDEEGYEGLKGAAYETEYGPECECTGFVAQ